MKCTDVSPKYLINYLDDKLPFGLLPILDQSFYSLIKFEFCNRD